MHIPSTISVDRLDPNSDESLDSRLHTRNNSIPNGVLAEEMQPLNFGGGSTNGSYNYVPPSFTVGGSAIQIPSLTLSTNLHSINEKTNSGSSSSSSTNNLTIHPTSTPNTLSPAMANTTYINNNQDRSNGNNGGSIKKTPSSGRRLSIKQDQLSVDSIC